MWFCWHTGEDRLQVRKSFSFTKGSPSFWASPGAACLRWMQAHGVLSDWVRTSVSCSCTGKACALPGLGTSVGRKGGSSGDCANCWLVEALLKWVEFKAINSYLFRAHSPKIIHLLRGKGSHSGRASKESDYCGHCTWSWERKKKLTLWSRKMPRWPSLGWHLLVGCKIGFIKKWFPHKTIFSGVISIVC